jgi:hypothetical protein
VAHWHSIKVVFDEPVPSAVLDLLGDAMVEADYDFPRTCLRDTGWHAYRSPMNGGDDLARLFLAHGARGQFWLSGNSDNYDDSQCHDADVVVFRPGVDPDSIAGAYRAKVHEERLQGGAKRYVEVARAFGVSPSPVKWDAVPLLHLYVPDHDRDRFEAAVALASEAK